MVKRDVIISRVNKLNEYINILKSIKKYDKETYISDPLLYGSSERFLHLSIECVLDIGNHVIADIRYRKPENNKDIFLVLYENKIIDEKLKNNLCNMASFRNILVHDYMKLDRGLVYEIINNNLKDIEEFVNVIIEYI
ncbi:type VII toxin-antitoxin system HepT family RNase toxin [Clostridium sp. DJ247]|uniref:type VII toxin-antitoxin system HepT family RNase toxin n=1 Tax=Clostridium sp. DJ247 TaxID=2726188 RepID=UPI00162AE54F|nr:DUF86 domain-containing protein [Clostridium sp. DJ247]MBC2581686.1 DUF86 domain-containing protein [Clostridium sp. DJ247]